MTKGQKFKAVKDLDVLYTFKLGGGVKGRKVKQGDVVTFLTIDNFGPCGTKMASCFELLRRMTLEDFKAGFVPA